MEDVRDTIEKVKKKNEKKSDKKQAATTKKKAKRSDTKRKNENTSMKVNYKRCFVVENRPCRQKWIHFKSNFDAKKTNRKNEKKGKKYRHWNIVRFLSLFLFKCVVFFVQVKCDIEIHVREYLVLPWHSHSKLIS